ncbi:hypothetical protein [Desertivirga brevis]|uniref:hypothetical protein n=1 Tax=Desertivirga brevis TaxID=2810310 RepID=UPI001A969571|nr:hypothetical protein [Pedobacter sp. SYSU D00873]
MALSEGLIKILNKTYEPLAMVNSEFKGNDLAFKTNEEGLPILLFIGKLDDKGQIKGERYARRLAKDAQGKIIKDHWELKGKAT